MNGLTRQTFTVWTQTAWYPRHVRFEGLLTYEEAEAQTRVALTDFLDSWLSDKRLLSFGLDHAVRLEPMQGSAHGMVIVELCENQPCVVVGQEPRTQLFSAWFGTNL